MRATIVILLIVYFFFKHIAYQYMLNKKKKELECYDCAIRFLRYYKDKEKKDE